MHGLGSLDRESHARCLISPDPALRRNAIRAIPNDLDGQKRLYDSATLADKDLLVRLDAFVKLASFELDDGIRKTASLLMQNQQNAKDEWLRLPLQAMGASELDLVGYESGPNLLPNPSFEDNDGKLPKGWKVRTYSGSGKAEHLIDVAKGFAKSGKASLRISSDGGHDTSAYATVKLKSGARYSLSAWIRTERSRVQQWALCLTFMSCNKRP